MTRHRDALVAVVLDLRRKNLDDGPCWCSVAPNATLPNHERKCLAAHAALAAKPEPGLDAVLRQLETDAGAADHDAIESGPDFARGIRYAIARLSAKEPTDEQR